MWRGAPLAEFDEPFARAEAAHLEELRLLCLEERIEAELVLGRHADAVPDIKALVDAHPLREGLHGQLMLALYRGGRQGEALAAYQRFRRTLDQELRDRAHRRSERAPRPHPQPGSPAPRRLCAPGY